MRNNLKIIKHSGLRNNEYIAVFSGKAATNDNDNGYEIVEDQEAHNIYADSKEELINKALLIWGAEEDETDIDFI